MEISSLFHAFLPALPPIALTPPPQELDNHEINRHKATDTASHFLPLKETLFLAF